MRWLLGAIAVGGLFLSLETVRAEDKAPETAAASTDARLGKARDLYDKLHPWTPPTDKATWEREAVKIRERMLVSNGLWPLPPKTPLNPVVHGKVDKGDYTVEKVYFQSHPGHYVTGNLYRPNPLGEKRAAVLCPYGHWPNGRFFDADEVKGTYSAEDGLKVGGEKLRNAARYPLQARMAQLARLGCVVFHYDMVGVADSYAIPHRTGFTDAEASLRLQNFMGLQTWNSIRALDFVTSLPEVDAARIGVTGASGGGTQTFMLCGVDPRPAAAFPAVMVSTDMQGGCVCENSDYLRIGVNNIAFAALFAPKPLAMSGADDWTINIEKTGLPELKQVYSLYGKTGLVNARAYPQFKHNYNLIARQMMYEWFNEHLKLGHKSPIEERDFEPIPVKELSVWDAEHPKPADFKDAAGLREYLTAVSEKQYADLAPTTPEKLAEYKRVVGTAARVMLDEGVPAGDALETSLQTSQLESGESVTQGTIGRKGTGEKVAFASIVPKEFSGTLLLVVNPRRAAASLTTPPADKSDVGTLLGKGLGIAGVDVLLTGTAEKPEYPKVNDKFPGYTFGYNRPVLSNRVRDILTAVAATRTLPGVKKVVLLGRHEGAVWALLARSLAGDQLDDAVINLSELEGNKRFQFTASMPADDPDFLPGALKYGGLLGLAAAGAPARLMVAGLRDVPAEERKAFDAAYKHSPEALTSVDEVKPQLLLERLAK